MLKGATGFKHIYLATGRTDLRKGQDSLLMMIKNEFDLDPFEPGNIFLLVVSYVVVILAIIVVLFLKTAIYSKNNVYDEMIENTELKLLDDMIDKKERAIWIEEEILIKKQQEAIESKNSSETDN